MLEAIVARGSAGNKPFVASRIARLPPALYYGPMDPAMPELATMFRRFAVALLLGFVLGIEREKEKYGSFAGVRTFTLVALMGCLSALAAQAVSIWFFAVAFALLGAVVIGSYVVTATREAPGITTEIASLLAFIYGAMAWWDLMLPAAALAVVTALVLAVKAPLQEITRRIGPRDLLAIIQLGLISVVVLPLLPNRPYGPLEVLNPRRIWWMVVLIATLNLAGYILVKLFGSRAGTRVGGLLGGLLSSTALTLAFSRRSRTPGAPAADYAIGVCLACTVMFPRVVVLTFLLSPDVARLVLPPMAAAAAAGLAGCLALALAERRQAAEPAPPLEPRNPFDLRPALQFGAFYALILVVSKAGQLRYGAAGVYASSFFSGLADLDAITLSLVNLSKHGMAAPLAAAGITIAAVTNTLFKAGLAWFLGSPALRRRAAPVLAAMGAIALLLGWALLV